MPSTHKNRVQMSVSGTPGTGTITLGSAASGYQSFSSAYGANATVDCLFEDGTAWEIARGCTYTHSGTTLSRGTLEASSTGSAISLTSAAVVSQIFTATQGQYWTDLTGVFGSEVISVTGAVTATIGAMHHCTGTSADYTVTLPAASGNSGKMLGFRMGSESALTKFVTLDGNSTETIDGATTRLMWAGETAILYCDGSNWFKVAGKTREMSAMMTRSTAQSFSSGSYAKAALNSEIYDVGGFADPTTNNRFDIKRTATYGVGLFGRFDGGSMEVVVGCFVNGAESFRCSAIGSTSISASGAQSINLTAGDYVELYLYQSSGGSINTPTGAIAPRISLVESATW